MKKGLTLARPFFMVGEEGIEPSIREEHDFESCAYTSSATRPCESLTGVRLAVNCTIITSSQPAQGYSSRKYKKLNEADKIVT
jgi:hypothetical protein